MFALQLSGVVCFFSFFLCKLESSCEFFCGWTSSSSYESSFFLFLSFTRWWPRWQSQHPRRRPRPCRHHQTRPRRRRRHQRRHLHHLVRWRRWQFLLRRRGIHSGVHPAGSPPAPGSCLRRRVRRMWNRSIVVTASIRTETREAICSRCEGTVVILFGHHHVIIIIHTVLHGVHGHGAQGPGLEPARSVGAPQHQQVHVRLARFPVARQSVSS